MWCGVVGGTRGGFYRTCTARGLAAGAWRRCLYVRRPLLWNPVLGGFRVGLGRGRRMIDDRSCAWLTRRPVGIIGLRRQVAGCTGRPSRARQASVTVRGVGRVGVGVGVEPCARPSGRCDVVWTDGGMATEKELVHRWYVRRPLLVARLAHDGGLAVAAEIVFMSCCCTVACRS